MCRYRPRCLSFCPTDQRGNSQPGLCTYLIELHQLLPIHLLGLVQWNELDLFRWEGLVCEGTLNSCALSVTLLEADWCTHCRDHVSQLTPVSAAAQDFGVACPAGL
jgi:hypothetical protein